MRSDRERLLDILEAIERIESRKGEYRSDFDSDEMLQIWFVHYLQIIGEAANRLSSPLRESHPQIPWGQMIGMRHILIHGYFEVDQEIVWNAVQSDLPKLKDQVKAILQQMDAHSVS